MQSEVITLKMMKNDGGAVEVSADDKMDHGGLQWYGHVKGMRRQDFKGKCMNGVFGKLPSHQMGVAIIVLIGKKIREINFGYRALPNILCAYKYIQCL